MTTPQRQRPAKFKRAIAYVGCFLILTPILPFVLMETVVVNSRTWRFFEFLSDKAQKLDDWGDRP